MRRITLLHLLIIAVIAFAAVFLFHTLKPTPAPTPAPIAATPPPVAPQPTLPPATTPAPQPEPIVPTLAPDGGQLLFSIPFNKSGKTLRVYSKYQCVFDRTNPPMLDACQGTNLDEELYLSVADSTDGIAVSLGTIKSESGANYGGIFVPIALTPDDKQIILNAWMGSPGAGGGSIDFGYAMIPVKAATKGTVLTGLPRIATRDAGFYDNYGKVVYLDESATMPRYSQPGPQYNRGVVLFRNLVTGVQKTILEQKDTTFQLGTIDEKASTVHLTATTYHFTTACPKNEEGYYCAKTTETKKTIPLP